MNITYRGIIDLVKSAITETPVALPEKFDWERAVGLIHFHKIEALAYYGTYYSRIKIPEPFKEDLEKCVFIHTHFDQQQQYEFKSVLKAFDEKSIAYLSLKGMILKKYYPKPEMRYMSDADILIKPDEYTKIEKIMSELGYGFKVESDHEYVWTKNTVCIELHKRLIPSYNKDYYMYYGDGWQLANQVNGKYEMSNEDFYIYLFTHLAKHYRDSGIGVKQFVDLWVFKRALPQLNQEYINAELEKLQLLDFHKNNVQLLDNWFESADDNGITEYMTEFIFSSGVYGTARVNELSTALKESMKMDKTKSLQRKFYLNKIFMPYSSMKKKYPFLERVPVLLPVMWIVRIVNAVFFDRKSIRANAERLNRLTNENVDAYESSLDYVGLKFDFKEKQNEN